MIRFFVAHFVVFSRTPWFWPPFGCLIIAARVWMCRLLLRLNSLYPGFCDEFAGCLLTLLKTLLVKVPNCFRVSYFNRTMIARCHGMFIVLTTMRTSPLSLPTRTGCTLPAAYRRCSTPFYWPVTANKSSTELPHFFRIQNRASTCSTV